MRCMKGSTSFCRLPLFARMSARGNAAASGAQPLAAEAGAGRRGVGPARGGVGSRRLVVGRIGIKRIGAGGGGARCASLSRCAGMGWRRRRGRAFGWLRWMHTEPRPSRRWCATRSTDRDSSWRLSLSEKQY
mmetsp:Transcript_30376/g.70890  ORF Transcript_30376/g.70890 Transcript_30376/m.70890 type:complete len:132 (+) Transcript_30376:416-811(+)